MREYEYMMLSDCTGCRKFPVLRIVWACVWVCIKKSGSGPAGIPVLRYNTGISYPDTVKIRVICRNVYVEEKNRDAFGGGVHCWSEYGYGGQ